MGLPSTSEDTNNSEGLLVERLEEVAGAYGCSQEASSPFDTVPNEIISIILEHGYLCTRNGLPDRSFRALASNLSRRFREVTLQTPSLWASVHPSPANAFDEIDFLPTYLERSKSYPLDIRLNCFWAHDLTEQFMGILMPHSMRWRRLSLSIVNPHALKFLEHVAVPCLNLLAISFYSNQQRVALPSPIFKNDLPQLQYLSLRNVDFVNIDFTLRNIKTLEIRGYGIWPNFYRLNEMIGQSTNLQYLSLHAKPAQVLAQLRTSLPGGQSSALGQIHLPALELLLVYTSEWLTQDIVDFIKVFNSPKLRALVLQESISVQPEKPTTIMTYLVRSKCLDPVALEAVWTEAWEGSVVKEGGQSELDGRDMQPTLWVKSSPLYLAFSAVGCSIASRLTALELNGVYFPPLAQMKEMFASLKNLQYLSIFDLVPMISLSAIRGSGVAWEDMIRVVNIPSLLTLVVVSRLGTPGNSLGIDLFFRMFNLPSLSFLLLKKLSFGRWCKVVEVFREGGVQFYPKLTSLKVVDMEDSIPDGSFIEGRGNPVAAFPRLEWLLLSGISSTCFLQCLLAEHDPTSDASEPVWPNLTSLAIANDPNTIRPLVHRVISARESFARPLKRLFLDSKFTMNVESFEWVKERVPVVEILPPRAPTFL